MSTILIGIAGGTGSGKTTLTRHLKEHFGPEVTVIGHDNYYKRQDGKTLEERAKVNYDAHFHAEYGGCKALIDIQNACVIRGALPSRQLKLILAWCELHKDELMQNWELARDAKPLNHVEPLI